MSTNTVSTPFPLGRVQVHDPRSRSFPAPTAGTVHSVNHTLYGPILDQGHYWFQEWLKWLSLGSCTGNSAAYMLNTKPHHKPRARYKDENDAVGYYSRGSYLDPWQDGWPYVDTGSSGLAVAKGLYLDQVIPGYSWTFGLDHLLGALQLGPVSIGIPWDETMFNPNSKGFIFTDPSREVGGHQITLTRLNMRHYYVTFPNSWSPKWGINGWGKLPLPELDKLLKRGGDGTVYDQEVTA